jgi:hypothetical protein
MLNNQKSPKQSTLDKLPVPPKEAIDIVKATPDPIDITQLQTIIKEEDELIVKISFKLPAKKAFSRVKANLWFDKQQISSVSIQVLQGPLATDESEFTEVLDMSGVKAGEYNIVVEMFGLWSLDEKISISIKEKTINHVPQTRLTRLTKVPSVKSVAGADLAVMTRNQSTLHHDLAWVQKREQLSNRDRR